MLPNCSSSIRWPTFRFTQHLAQLLRHFVGAADDDVAGVDDVVPRARRCAGRRCRTRLCRGLGDLAIERARGSLLRSDIRAGRSKLRVDVQTAAIEVLGRFLVEPIRFFARLGHADELQETGAIRIAVLAAGDASLPRSPSSSLRRPCSRNTTGSSRRSPSPRTSATSRPNHRRESRPAGAAAERDAATTLT